MEGDLVEYWGKSVGLLDPGLCIEGDLVELVDSIMCASTIVRNLWNSLMLHCF